MRGRRRFRPRRHHLQGRASPRTPGHQVGPAGGARHPQPLPSRPLAALHDSAATHRRLLRPQTGDDSRRHHLNRHRRNTRCARWNRTPAGTQALQWPSAHPSPRSRLWSGVELLNPLPKCRGGDGEHPEQHEDRDGHGRQPHPHSWRERQAEHGNHRDQTERHSGGTGRQPPGEPLERGTGDTASSASPASTASSTATVTTRPVMGMAHFSRASTWSISPGSSPRRIAYCRPAAASSSARGSPRRMLAVGRFATCSSLSR
jgi:hypothetical protein